MALAVLLLFSTIGMNGLLINVIIAHAMFLLALPLVTISLGLESVDRSVLEASQTMGAPFAVAGFALCFVLSLNDQIIALTTVGFTVETLPIKIFKALRYGYTPVIASIAVVFMLINILVFSLTA